MAHPDINKLKDASLSVHRRAVELLQAGKDPEPLLKEKAILDLRWFCASDHPDLTHVRINANTANINGCCPACSALSGEVIGIIKEMKSPRLPVAGCTCDNYGYWCTCYYEAVFDDELRA